MIGKHAKRTLLKILLEGSYFVIGSDSERPTGFSSTSWTIQVINMRQEKSMQEIRSQRKVEGSKPKAHMDPNDKTGPDTQSPASPESRSKIPSQVPFCLNIFVSISL